MGSTPPQYHGTVQNEVENEERNEEDLKAIEAKKMWWHAKLECRVIEVCSKEALEWYRRVINGNNSSLRAWTWYEKPEPRLKVWIKPQFSHLTPTKYIELCLKFHPSIKNQPWHLESITDEDRGKRTVYISPVGKSVIDITFTSPYMLNSTLDWKVLEESSRAATNT